MHKFVHIQDKLFCVYQNSKLCHYVTPRYTKKKKVFYLILHEYQHVFIPPHQVNFFRPKIIYRGRNNYVKSVQFLNKNSAKTMLEKNTLQIFILEDSGQWQIIFKTKINCSTTYCWFTIIHFLKPIQWKWNLLLYKVLTIIYFTIHGLSGI